jgi:ribosomal protein S18 acetylase RimI-like enzyme
MKSKKVQIQVRRARASDVPALVNLWLEFSREHERIVVRKTRSFAAFYSRRDDVAEMADRFFRKDIRSRNWGVYIAEAGGFPAGYALFTIKKTPPVYKIDTIGYIDSLYIRKPFRGAGLSSRFKDIAADWFRKKGLSHMSLNVAPENTHARSIYTDWGFLEHQIEMRMKV